MKRDVVVIVVTLLLSACTGPAVDKAVGTGAGAEATPLVVTASGPTVVIENHAGRPLLNVRVAVAATGASSPFIRVVPTIDTNQSMTLQLSDFRTDDAVMFDPAAAVPTQVTVQARDTLAKSYEATASWK